MKTLGHQLQRALNRGRCRLLDGVVMVGAGLIPLAALRVLGLAGGSGPGDRRNLMIDDGVRADRARRLPPEPGTEAAASLSVPMEPVTK